MKALARLAVMLVLAAGSFGCAITLSGPPPEPACEKGVITGRTVVLSAPAEVWDLAAQRIQDWLKGIVIEGPAAKNADFLVAITLRRGRVESYSSTEIYSTPYRDRRGRIRERTRIETYATSPDVDYSVSVRISERILNGFAFRCSARARESFWGSADLTQDRAVEGALWKLF
ncbi:MAG: hypothetical protein AAB539_01775 [Patescibacteria group bacterium]